MRILIAEDEPLEAEALRRRLEALGHRVVEVVHDGAKAIAQAEGLRPDLVFLDFRMPKLDGITAAAKILAHRPVPVILLTGQADLALIARAEALGVMGHLVKPVDRPDLEKAIALAVSRFAKSGLPAGTGVQPGIAVGQDDAG